MPLQHDHVGRRPHINHFGIGYQFAHPAERDLREDTVAFTGDHQRRRFYLGKPLPAVPLVQILPIQLLQGHARSAHKAAENGLQGAQQGGGQQEEGAVKPHQLILTSGGNENESSYSFRVSQGVIGGNGSAKGVAGQYKRLVDLARRQDSVQVGKQAGHIISPGRVVWPRRRRLPVAAHIHRQHPVNVGERLHLVLPLPRITAKAMQQHQCLRRALRADVDEAEPRARANFNFVPVEFQIKLHG